MSTGCRAIDQIMGGGMSAGEVALLFGERGSGKTSLAFQAMVSAAQRGLGATMLYTEGRAPVERLTEIAGASWPSVGDLCYLLEAKTFEEQDSIIESLQSQIPPGTALMVIDSINSLYRARLGEHDENISINKSLSRQLALLKAAARGMGIAVLITSEVRAQLDSNAVQPVAYRILGYWVDRAVRLEKLQGSVRKATSTKPPPERDALIKVTPLGLEGMGASIV
ncbi:MAG TPA: ATPase domain-containing protein [Candidatus Methanomethylicus sp.]|nr:ATPase domain-containing protein [Candidatus Methanomethylicus sp.]